MEMEVDEGVPDKNSVFIWCITKKHGLKKSRLGVDNFGSLKVEGLNSAVLQELNKWEWFGDDKPKNIDILHCSRVLKTDEDVKRIGPLSVITAIVKDVKEEEDHKSSKFIAEYAKSRNINEQLRSCVIALKTAFLNPKFIEMIENLGDSEKMDNLFAIVPELKNDPVAIGIIQNPTLIFHLSDPEALKKVVSTKPWIIEAFNFITASIHQERQLPPQGIPSSLFNASLFDGDDESMEEGEDDDNSPGLSRGASAITREQLAAALNALGGGMGGGPSSAAGLASAANAFGGLFQPPTRPQAGPTAPAAPPTPNQSAGANIQNLMNSLVTAGGGAPGQALTGDMVARAVTDALRRLPPEQRAGQLDAIRNAAAQVQQQGSLTPSAPIQPRSPAQPTTQPAAPQQASTPTSASLAQQYQSQLRQMREMGITDERLSILALRVSEGDLNTAVELIFSGWQGEGSDPI